MFSPQLIVYAAEVERQAARADEVWLVRNPERTWERGLTAGLLRALPLARRRSPRPASRPAPGRALAPR
jgi:hypothetical protein